MRIAYIIVAHHLPDQLVRLIDRLSGDGVSFLVHVNRLEPAMYNEVRRLTASRTDVRFLPSQEVKWGGWGLTGAALSGLAEVASWDEIPDYALLLSGQHYPIKANPEIRAFLDRAEGKSVFERWRMPWPNWGRYGGMERIRFWHRPLLNRRFLIPVRRRYPVGFQPYGGSVWWCLSRSAIRYIADFSRQNPRFVRFHKHVWIPDEIFFSTVISNSLLRDEVINTNATYITWPSVESARPKTLGMEDLPTLRASDKLFARKFDSSVDPRLLDAVDEQLLDVPSPALPRG